MSATFINAWDDIEGVRRARDLLWIRLGVNQIRWRVLQAE